MPFCRFCHALAHSLIFPQKHMSQPMTDLQFDCVTSKDSGLPVYPLGIARVLVYFSSDSPEAVEGTCHSEDRSDCWDVQADLSLRWLHKSFCTFCYALAHNVGTLEHIAMACLMSTQNVL